MIQNKSNAWANCICCTQLSANQLTGIRKKEKGKRSSCMVDLFNSTSISKFIGKDGIGIPTNRVACDGKSSKKSRFLPGLRQSFYVSFRRYYPDQVMRVYFSEFFFVISPNIAAWPIQR
jgi:hypothetical protein